MTIWGSYPRGCGSASGSSRARAPPVPRPTPGVSTCCSWTPRTSARPRWPSCGRGSRAWRTARWSCCTTTATPTSRAWPRRCASWASRATPPAASSPSYTEVQMSATGTRVSAPEKLLLAAPRGYCAGVDRAVQTVEHALDLYGAPVYVRKEIVHNKHVVEELRERGAIFVDQETEVPEGATVVFSAHGVAPSVHTNAAERDLFAIDATCPLVTKAPVEAKKLAGAGYTIVLIGHAGHEEVEGTMGEAPDDMLLIETEEDVDRLEVDDPDKLAYLTQTTLSGDETRTTIN